MRVKVSKRKSRGGETYFGETGVATKSLVYALEARGLEPPLVGAVGPGLALGLSPVGPCPSAELCFSLETRICPRR